MVLLFPRYLTSQPRAKPAIECFWTRFDKFIPGCLLVIQHSIRIHASSYPLLNRILVHVSTAFVHGRNSGTSAAPLPQHLPDLGGRDPAKLYRSAQNAALQEGRNPRAGGGGKDAINAINELGYPNTYTFTKAIGEHLLARAIRAHNRRCEEQERRVALDCRDGNTPGFPSDIDTLDGGVGGGHDDQELGRTDGQRRWLGAWRGAPYLKLKVVRPSIVGPSWVLPWAGWTGEQPSTVTGGPTKRRFWPFLLPKCFSISSIWWRGNCDWCCVPSGIEL